MKKSNYKTGVQIKKLDNKGMTLIELIIAVAILVLAAIPLVYGFISSAKYNAKARIKHQTTAVAQTIIEDFKANPMELMVQGAMSTPATLANINFSNLVFADGGSNNYTFALNDAMYEGIAYDCNISVTPRSNAVAVGDVVKFNDVADGRDAVYTANRDMDAMAYERILKEICTYWDTQEGAVIAHNTSEVYTDCVEIKKREMKFAISQSGNGTSPVKATVQVFYTFQVTDHPYQRTDGSMGTFDITETVYEYPLDGSETASPMVIFDNDGVTYDDGQNHYLEKLIIYYYPAYKRVPSGVSNVIDTDNDVITITNTSAHAVQSYIYKQKNPYLSEARLSNCEVVYAPKIVLSNSSDSLMDDNFGENISEYGTTVAGATVSGTRKTGGTDTKKNVQLMYDIRVDVFNKDAYSGGTFTGTPLCTMNATLVE